MTETSPIAEVFPVQIRLDPVVELSDDQFLAFCRLNRDVRLERTVDGDIVILPPVGGETGARNANLVVSLGLWAREDGSGIVFDSSAGFRLRGKSVRAPDAAWVERSRLAQLTPEQKKKFLPLCPDFAIELRSPSDALAGLQETMEEYLDSGLRLGWLIDPPARSVYVYRAGESVEHLENPLQLSGDPVLRGFVLDLRRIWEPGF